MTSYKDMHCAIGGSQWSRQHVTPSDEGTSLSLDGLSTWTESLYFSGYGGAFFAFMWCSYIWSIFRPLSFHSVINLFQKLSCWGCGSGELHPSVLFLSGLLWDSVLCSDKCARKFSSLSLTRCLKKVYSFKSGLGDRKPSEALLWLSG